MHLVHTKSWSLQWYNSAARGLNAVTWYGCTLDNQTQSCSSSTQFNDLHTRLSLSVLSRWTPSAQRPVSTRRPWYPVLNRLLFDAHLTTDRYSAGLYSSCIVLYSIKLLCWSSAKYSNACWCLALSMTDAMSYCEKAAVVLNDHAENRLDNAANCLWLLFDSTQSHQPLQA